MKLADATIKNVTLPTEHGASVMLGESLCAGLFIAASAKGFLPALGWLFIFLLIHPFKIAVKDMSHGIMTARTSTALWCSAVFGLLAGSLIIATYIVSGFSFLFVLAGVIPLGILHLWAVVNANKRELTAELSGALSLGAPAASILLVAGHPYAQALALWTVLAVRALTSVIYVRERLNQSRGKINNIGLVEQVHTAGMAVLWAMVLVHLVKPLIFIAGFLLVMRLWLLYQRRPITAINLGLQELMLGAAFVILTIFSF
ncbi:MAG: YwiC-like family protein [Candidatus Omnitrophica bacterium]|nr:YwiC-like family protein [Candidatus Omnitrophota bacterium]